MIDPPGYVNGGSCVAEHDGDAYPVELGVGRAESGPSKVAVDAKMARGLVGLVKQLVSRIAPVVLGGGDSTA